tara:strand:+ start:104 stop:331 length:228 start_codon:yes stop_codon:yes gene_type:complete
MDKYFSSLDQAAILMVHEIDSPKAQKLFRHVLQLEHGAGAEADYIIRTWKEERGFDEESNDQEERGFDEESNHCL